MDWVRWQASQWCHESLIKDQIESFTRKVLSRLFANLSDEETQQSVLTGEYQLLYISLESLLAYRQWREIVQSPPCGHVYHVHKTLIIALQLDTIFYSLSRPSPYEGLAS